MEKVKYGFKWVLQNFFFIAIAIYLMVSTYEFWLLPHASALSGAIIWVLLNLIIATAYRVFRSRAYLGKALLAILVFFFSLNAWQIHDMLYTKVVDTAKLNGTTYYLVEHLDYSEPISWRDYSLTKWSGLFIYKSYGVGERRVEMRYDEKMKLVYVVNVEWDSLVFIDSTPPVFFAEENETELNGKKYVLANDCHPNPLNHYLCETFTYMVYQCELDYTLCAPFPFQYDGKYIFEMLIENDISPGNINIYFAIGKYPGTKTLIFTQGDTPICHAEGCEILNQP